MIKPPTSGNGAGGSGTPPTVHDLTSQVDGIETVFTLSPAADTTSSIMIFSGGAAMKPGLQIDGADYQINSVTEIEFYTAPPVDVNLIAYYVEA